MRVSPKCNESRAEENNPRQASKAKGRDGIRKKSKRMRLRSVGREHVPLMNDAAMVMGEQGKTHLLPTMRFIYNNNSYLFDAG